MRKIIKFLLLFVFIKMNIHTTALGMHSEITKNDTLAMQDTVQQIEIIKAQVEATVAHNLRLKPRQHLFEDLAKQINIHINDSINFIQQHQMLADMPLIMRFTDDLINFQQEFNKFMNNNPKNTPDFVTDFLTYLQIFINQLQELQQLILEKYHQNTDHSCSLYQILVSAITIGTLCFWMHQLKALIPFSFYLEPIE